jgi:tRNA (mo5U34)-methyltransferase
MDISELADLASQFESRLATLKLRHEPRENFWYPYRTLANISLLRSVLKQPHRDLMFLIGEKPVADIGAGDGDIAFFMESIGVPSVEIIDHAPTNFNGLEGARLLKELLGSNVTIHDLDIEGENHLPSSDYGLVFFLGILYHLKNPFRMLEMLAKNTEYCLLSTRIAKLLPDKSTKIDDFAVAYLLDERESNNDPTNYWVLSRTGLLRLLTRTGWSVLDLASVGDVERSDPVSADADERAFCLLRRSGPAARNAH